MHRILYVDLFPCKAHHQLNRILVESLRSIGPTDIWTSEGYFEEPTLALHSYPKWIGKIKSCFVRSVLYIFCLKSGAKLDDYEKIIVSTFDTRAFAVAGFLFGRRQLEKMVLFHHYNIDSLIHPFDMWCFAVYKNRVKHIVFESYFKQRLVESYHVQSERIFVVPHPCLQAICLSGSVPRQQAVALSASNSLELVRDLIAYESETRKLIEHHYLLIIKSLYEGTTPGSIKLLNGFLRREEYDDLIASSKIAVLFHPRQFKYRESGYLIDALANGRLVVGYGNCDIVRHYSSCYPNICFAAKDHAELIHILIASRIDDKSAGDFKRFAEDHSIARYTAAVLSVLNAKE